MSAMSDDRRFLFGLTAVSFGVMAASTLGALLLFAGTAGVIAAMMLAMLPSEPQSTLALDPGVADTLRWTEGPHAQEIWVELDVSHHFQRPWLSGELEVDGQPRAIDFSGEAFLEGQSAVTKYRWISSGDQSQGWVRVMKLPQGGQGAEHSVQVRVDPGPQTTVRVLRLHVVDCDNWSCDPDRLF